ncbi:hypothetical protein CRE_19759 [Caenorhabditis remanei]|uniref:Serpentine receptor class r-10 n=1 Tax=Caenorhabditis remanei TaxID=31234 RepID=E3MTN5_CAERE|nr:hypothetical protein CRE_19759 [Caenorhabditis remanei]
MDGLFKDETWIGNNVVCLYCGSFALVISLLATQFYYRYVVFCRPEMMNSLNGWKLVRLFIPSMICVIIYYTIVKFGMAMTTQKKFFLKQPLELNYHVDSEKVMFFGPMYWGIGENGDRKWNIEDLLSAVGCFAIIVICMSTIIYCATKIYLQLKSKSDHFSAKTIELNRQLFITLVFQTLLPFVMMYSPVGLIITFPFFEVPVGRAANFVGASLSIYPCLEPLIAMICIKDFRKVWF